MPSTTGKAWSMEVADARPRAVEPVAAEGLELGMNVLLDLVRHMRLPADVEQERQALLALQAIHRRARLSDPCVAMRCELERFVELAEEPQVRKVVEWIRGRSRWTRRRRQRLLLLFVLLAKTVAPEDRFGILRTLNKLQLWGHQSRLEDLLAAARPRLRTPARLALGRTYFRVAGEILITPEPEGNATVTVEQFRAWGWAWQLVQLLAWRSTAASNDREANPVFHAGTLEFRLAGVGAYRRLARRGGAVAAGLLRELDYRDYRAVAGRRSAMPLLLLTGLVLTCVLVGLLIRGHLREIDRANASFAAEVLESYSQGDD